MIYLRKIENEGLENEQVFVFKFEDESRIGAGFQDWHRMTAEEIYQYEVKEVKAKKIASIDANKNYLVSNSIFVMTIDGIDFNFKLKSDDVAIIKDKIDSLKNDSDTLGWTMPDKTRVQLNKVIFRRLLSHIRTNDEHVRNLCAEKIQELETLVESEASLEEVNNFNTNLIE